MSRGTGVTLTCQFFELWRRAQRGAFLAYRCGRSLRAKGLVFPSKQRRQSNPDLFRQSLRTSLLTIKPEHGGAFHGVRVSAESICPRGHRLRFGKGLAGPCCRQRGPAMIA